MVLYDYPTANSTDSVIYKVGPDTITSQFDLISDGIQANLANIAAVPSIGNGVVDVVTALESGKGYVSGELVQMYISGGVANPTIEDGGTGYANGENLVFSGGDPAIYPTGTVETDGSGTIISVVMTNNGSGLISTPVINITTVAGSGASLITELTELNPASQITGTVIKTGIGKKRGFWSTTRSHLNSDKYIQDSFFYQDFSYQIETPLILSKYSEILYDTFHIAGAELFGKFKLISENANPYEILYSNTAASLTFHIHIFADDTVIKADSTIITSDSFFQWATADRTIITADEILPTVDFVE
jgi:hypothetical protein